MAGSNTRLSVKWLMATTNKPIHRTAMHSGGAKKRFQLACRHLLTQAIGVRKRVLKVTSSYMVACNFVQCTMFGILFHFSFYRLTRCSPLVVHTLQSLNPQEHRDRRSMHRRPTSTFSSPWMSEQFPSLDQLKNPAPSSEIRAQSPTCNSQESRRWYLQYIVRQQRV